MDQKLKCPWDTEGKRVKQTGGNIRERWGLWPARTPLPHGKRRLLPSSS